MATAVIMPRQGQSVESCIIGEWYKKVGDRVEEGELLFSYETDKSAFEEPAKLGGTLLAIFYGVNDDVPCLETVAVIGEPGEDYTHLAPRGSTPAQGTPAYAPAASEPAAEPIAAAAAPASAGAAERGISPRARQAAQRLRVDPGAAPASGPHGRVIERDMLALAKEGRTGMGLGGRLTEADKAMAAVEAAPAAAAASAAMPSPSTPAVAEYEDVKLTNIRKVIAKSMQQSLSTTAQLTHTSSFDATAILALRKQLKAAGEKMAVPNITLNDILLFAVSRVLPKHPDLNAHFFDDRIRRFKGVHLGVAVDTPRGLMVPTLFHADQKSLSQIAAEAKALAAACQDGSINPDLLQGASFTVSNLGALGVEHFTPVINPPQAGILGVNCIIERVRTVEGQLTAYPAMGLSLTYDHRALDGAPASRFLQELCTALENFNALLIG
ncbi:MAG: dihydrolipoamide acetyltransferase family protein [Candidatus Pelethousia sp.]|nr:dihydrolipoamide acetyltransferase family protein [Candidatus Pelethousia sp.]